MVPALPKRRGKDVRVVLVGGGCKVEILFIIPLRHFCSCTINSLFLEVRTFKYGNGVARLANPENGAPGAPGLSANTQLSMQACREWTSLGQTPVPRLGVPATGHPRSPSHC